MEKRFLIVNPFGVGDVLFSTPLLRALKDRFPNCVVGYLCNRRTYEILETHPLIQHLFVYEKDELKRSRWKAVKTLYSLYQAIRKERFDVVLDFSLAPEFSFALKGARIPRRIGLDYKHRGRFLTDRVVISGFDEKPIPEYYLEVLRPLGWDPMEKVYPTELWTDEKDEAFADSFFHAERLGRNVVGVSPGGGAAFGSRKGSYRRWGASRFAKLCDLLWENLGVETLLFTTQGEEEIAESLIRDVQKKPVVSRGTTIRQMAGLMKRCRVVVCNDSGPLHVAVAVGTPTVSLFGPVDPLVYGPYPPGPSHCVLRQTVPCSPCYRRFKLPECERNVCLQWIEPLRVFESVKECLAHENP